MEGLKKYDYVFIDCPPTLSLLTLNALTATQNVYIPLQTEFFSFTGNDKAFGDDKNS